MSDKSLLIVEDDELLANSLSKAMAKRDFCPIVANSIASATTIIRQSPPAFAVVDLRLADGNGLNIVDQLRSVRENSRIIMLSGYANIPTAVAAVKAGAVDFLPKPVDADDIEKALLAPPGSNPEPPENPTPPHERRLSHILTVYEANDRNVSKTARKLQMHRRTLQRILQNLNTPESIEQK